MSRHVVFAILISASAAVGADDPGRILDAGKKPADSRLVRQRTLDDKDFFFKPPASKEEWEKRRRELREQILVATGLWPLPAKTPLNATVHGKIDRDEYTIEKVFFASTPGHYVSGNLYRPKGKSGRLPGVLFAHGHWQDGRLHDAGEAAAKRQVESGAEGSLAGGRYPLQALPVQLARMGCVVFVYDMVGVADDKAIGHGVGFADVDAELRLQSAMGLQTWNSVRALDFLAGLDDVDPKRLAMTGASGGGTQTFILCAIDDRPAAAFPAVMVSTQMQGGCVCENASLLRLGTGNVEFAGLFAPKPLGMTGARDWTVDIERKGLPELKALYKLYGAEAKVMAKCFPQFEHNYNQVSREVMENWFNEHLGLGLKGPIKERSFEPVAPKDLAVYDAGHPRPKDELDAAGLRRQWSAADDARIEALRPSDGPTLKEYQRVVGTALRVMVDDTLPPASEVEETRLGEMQAGEGFRWRSFFLGRKGRNEQIPAVGVLPPEWNGRVVVWIHPEGKKSLFRDGGRLTAEAQQIVDGKAAILAVDVFGVGELALDKPFAVDKRYAGYTFGYNRSLLAERVHDILTAVAHAKGHEKTKSVDLVGWGKAGPWVLLARGLCGDAVARTAADFDRFRFDKVRTVDDEMMLPGALKYGGLPAFAALAAPGELFTFNHQGTGAGRWLKGAYSAAGAGDQLRLEGDAVKPAAVLEWLLR